MDYLIKKKSGQALVELAAFGSILLLCLAMLIRYGMQANYQQNLQMQAFRKALHAAYYKSGPSSGASVAMRHDKPIPDPRDPWGIPERHPITAGATVTWDNYYHAPYVEDYEDYVAKYTGGFETLWGPHSIIEINDVLALSEDQIRQLGNLEVAKDFGMEQGIFRIAALASRKCVGSISVVLENPIQKRHPSPSRKEEYRTIEVPCNRIRVKNRGFSDDGEEARSGREAAYFQHEGLIHQITSADLTNDNWLETIVAVKGSSPCDKNGDCGLIDEWVYLDYSSGEIDNKFADLLPWKELEVDGKEATPQDHLQGLLNKYSLAETYNSVMVKMHDPDHFTTITTPGAAQKITHYIRLNKESELKKYPKTFTPKYGPEGVSRPEEVDAENWGWSK